MATPIILCDCAGMSEKRWLECREHGPKGDIEYTVGGSEVIDRVVQMDGEQAAQFSDRVTKLGKQQIQAVHEIGDFGLPAVLDGHYAADVDGILKAQGYCHVRDGQWRCPGLRP